MASIFWSRAQYILFTLHRPRTIVSIQRNTGYSRPTIVKLVQEMEKLGLVRTNKEGKYTIVYTTEKGKELRKKLLSLYYEIEPDTRKAPPSMPQSHPQGDPNSPQDSANPSGH